jgi:Tol biopolymer transport system component
MSLVYRISTLAIWPTLLVGACGSDAPPTSPPPSSTRLLFQEVGTDGMRVYTVDPDGANLVLVARDSTDMSPHWSPDGSRIAFTGRRSGNDEIMMMNSDGTRIQNLTNNPADDREPAWSPDGNSLVFTTGRVFGPLRLELAVMAADGTGFRRLGLTGFHPTWSPDGDWIAFSEFLPDGYPAIFIVRPNGTGLQQLTDGSTYDIQPRWSPDSQSLVFTSLFRSADSIAHLYRISLAGGAPVPVTADPAYADYQAAWSSVSNLIAVQCRRPHSQAQDPTELCVLEADGSNRRILDTGLGGQHTHPDWFDPVGF